MKIISALIDEVLPDALTCRRAASLSCLRPHLADDGFLLIIGEESWHHTRGEHVVNQLQEALLSDVLIGEQEDRLLPLDAELVVEDLEVISEAGLVVAAAEFDLKDLAAGSEGG